MALTDDQLENAAANGTQTTSDVPKLIVRSAAGRLHNPRNALGHTIFFAEVIRDSGGLEALSDALTELSANAVEPNVFYEPWVLLPALEAFGSRSSFQFVCIFASRSGKAPVLCGFFPLRISTNYRGLPIRIASLWNYLYFEWRAPLLRKGFEVPAFETFLRWTESAECQGSLIELKALPVEGACARALIEALTRLGKAHYVADLHTRALLKNCGDAEAALRESIPGHKLKEFGRLQRRLSELGSLTFEELDREDDFQQWVEGFLNLEFSGWKGREGTALACNPVHREFFIRAATEAFSRKQLMMLRLRVDNRVLAYKCNFLSAPGAFAFKIAYDEEYRAFSPGVLLELENMRRFQTKNGFDWMDSCADANHFMANHLWKNRRALQTIFLPTRSAFSELSLAILPLVKWARKRSRTVVAPQTRRAM